MNPILPEQSSQRDFGFLVSTPTNAGHDLRAFGFGENVSHRPKAVC